MKKMLFISLLIISLFICSCPQNDNTTTTVASDTAEVTITLTVPDDTPADDIVYLGHEVDYCLDWLPYATECSQLSSTKWKAVIKLKKNTTFKFRPTRGGWSNQSREEEFSYYVNYNNEQSASFTVESWYGNMIPNQYLIRKGVLVFGENSTSYKLTWQDNDLTKDTVWFGKEGTVLQPQSISTNEIGKTAEFNNLDKGSKYAVAFDETGDPVVFSTPPTDNNFSFVVFADTQSKKTDIETVFAKIKSDNPLFCVSGGDLTHTGQLSTIWKYDFYDLYEKYLQNCPLIAVRGNHEYSSELFNINMMQDKTYRSLVYNNVLFLMIDSENNFKPGSDQYNFIENTLKNSNEEWKIVVMHQSPYSSAPRHYSHFLAREQLVPVFEKYNVDIVFAGHNHVYEKTKPINDIIYVTLPSAGGSTPESDDDSPEEDWTEKRVFQKFGYSKVDIADNKMSVTIRSSIPYVDMDSFVLTK